MARLILLLCLFLPYGCLTVSMPGDSYEGKFLPLQSGEQQIERGLRQHIKTFSRIGERNYYETARLKRARNYIIKSFKQSGLDVKLNTFKVRDDRLSNIYMVQPGQSPKSLVIGAHYDTAIDTPGANDNGSGTAALLELIRLHAKKKYKYTIIWVAFVNEEPPWFQTDLMGSLVFARLLKENNTEVAGMLSLETMGYYTDEEESQHYPWPFSWFYPDKGNFVAFVANRDSKQLVRRVAHLFRNNCKFPSEGVAAPGFITGLGWSDHWSFWQVDYPAIMVTDTAPFRYEHYHKKTDTYEKINFAATARVVQGLSKVITELAQQGVDD